jgi:hypothetical protein
MRKEGTVFCGVFCFQYFLTSCTLHYLIPRRTDHLPRTANLCNQMQQLMALWLVLRREQELDIELVLLKESEPETMMVLGRESELEMVMVQVMALLMEFE